MIATFTAISTEFGEIVNNLPKVDSSLPQPAPPPPPPVTKAMNPSDKVDPPFKTRRARRLVRELASIRRFHEYLCDTAKAYIEDTEKELYNLYEAK